VFLKGLTLKGFKSFAAATELVFEPGVTVVVGPNGSGKSNVVDAIAWVLGAQAPSAVRSQKMDDVIFAGTSKRSALGRAEVSLTIDNSLRVLPIEFEEVTITRTLFRTGESEYALNGVSCRLLDIQELLSDSGVGRQQHVIISQGQIDAVLNARPEDRRAIIEEAAGVLKYRRRKEKSERRLKATEANLTRLGDLLREVRRQLKPLERQAEAARRHGDLVDELTQLRIHVVGREVAELKSRLQQSAELRTTFAGRERELKTELRDLDTQVISSEAQLSAAGVGDLSDVLVRCESVRERLRGLDALLVERVRGLDRERETSVDGAVRSTLEADLEQARLGLADIEKRATALKTEAEQVTTAEAELATEREAFAKQWGEGPLSVSDETARVRGELGARSQAREQTMGERSGLAAAVEELRTKSNTINAEVEKLRKGMEQAEAQERELVERLEAISGRHTEAHDSFVAAERVLNAAIVDERRWSARAEALDLAMSEIRSGADNFEGIAGVVGQLVELVTVADGFDKAFAAAIGESAAAMVLADPGAARAAVEALNTDDAGGLILALGLNAPAASKPAIGDPLRPHVSSDTPGMGALLDDLLAHVGVFGSWDDAIDAAIANPAATIVTRDGGCLSPGGWRLGGERLAATGAALTEAQEAAAVSGEQVAAAQVGVDEATRVRAAVEDERGRLEAQLQQADDKTVATGESLSLLLRDLRDVGVEIEGLDERIADLDSRLTRDGAHIDELTTVLKKLEADEAEQLEQGQLMNAESIRLDQRAAAVTELRADLDVRASALDEQREFLDRRLDDVTQRLARHASDDEEQDDSWTIDDRIRTTRAIRGFVGERIEVVSGWLDVVRAERQRQTEEVQSIARELDGLRQARSKNERALAELRERHSRAEIDDAEITVRLEAAVDILRRELDTEAGVAMKTPPPPLADGVKPAVRLRELERELRLMGPVNPLALQEYDTLSERFDFLTTQLEDVKASRRELNKVIQAIDAEIMNVFTSAFADVSENFEKLFVTLFPGGKGALKLTNPTNVLETGIEVEARPSGKNVRKLSLLSGGERSLTALAFLFAVFRSRPSPFYVMDEVEAALDDVNLHRFLELVAEFRDDAQLLIVSHQKRTMEAADCLYGVTMQPGESSVVVSEKSGADMSIYAEPTPAAEAVSG